MEEMQMVKKIAQLESLNDQLVAELIYLDELMRLVGFSSGLKTVKAAARELVRQGFQGFDNEKNDV